MPDGKNALPITSSGEPNWTPEARRCYGEVLHILEKSGIRFIVGGAFAVHRHTGIWRSTKDLDLLLAPAQVSPALKVLQREGFKTQISDPIWPAKAERGEYFVDLISGKGNAALTVGESWIERAVPGDFFGSRCRVVASEDLIASKVFVTRRERFDGSDIVHLIRSCGANLNWKRILALLDCHWELVFWHLVLFAYVYPAQTDLIPESVWSTLANQFRKRVTNPDKNEPFRGSLVDPRMFAIDVNEWGERNLYEEFCARLSHDQRIKILNGSEG